MAEVTKPKSGIIGQAKVVFGGGIHVEFGESEKYPETICVGLAELIEPCEKSGQVPKNSETYMGSQVQLVFPDLESLSFFRDTVLSAAELALKDKVLSIKNDKKK